MKIFKLLKKDTWIKPFLSKYAKSMILALFLGFMTFFCAGALMFNSGYLISKSASLPENILLVYVPIVLTRAFGIGRPVFRYLERLTSHNWVLKLTSELRLKLYNVLEKDAVFFKDKHQTGDILGVLSDDIDHIQNLYLRTIFPTIVGWLLYVVIVLALGYFSCLFSLVMLLLLGVLTILMPLTAMIVNGAKQEKQKTIKNTLYSGLTDNVLGVSDWIFSQRGRDYVKQHDQEEGKLRDVNHHLANNENLRNFLVQLVVAAITVAILFWTAFQFPGDHGGAANWIAAFVLVIFPLGDAFTDIPGAAQETNIYEDSLVRLNNLSDNESQSISNDQAADENSQKLAASITAPVKFEVKNLSFRYDEQGLNVLEKLDLSISQGEKLAILGRSGSGKTTLIHLLRGDLKPVSGQILLNGVPVSGLGENISQFIGVIHQAPYLFRTSVRNNLKIGNENASDEELWDVLDRVGLTEMVMRLPDRLDTQVDEAGHRFSGGERHRMALARILLQNVPVVILDEPTVSLDPVTEQDLIETFVKELSGKTLIWVTHHLQGLSLMDQVIFIEDGKLKLNGSPEQLANENSYYQKLLRIDRGSF
ncbi:thiol reductant ABC exporter subunit CydC [Ligilactobacillus pobuzihii]|uniref:Transport ATP-binding protein CydD n=1 Tax=Ligilactobacillus pobuzihii TaxID=449659 RepID=A0A0R2L1X3_9LACO|nr:thiol reductant ABC exporter subunit CydC [Ligilactobacillus pobuzihii]KRK09945.1 transport ATP-binding protein CydD [Ligilactobacillus pobuzihii E100301 = KCTC 13174]KRN95634.1 transport ATP-binding protein CydD [Ligilactobacillus pobuzihii]GEN47948.1 amino acid ABC transporter ATP-binding protein [Ligilactobacillus pobuzihii]